MSDLIKSNTLCNMFDISVPTLYRWVKSGKLPKPMVANNRRYWKRDEIEAAKDKMFGGGDLTVSPVSKEVE